LRGLGVDGNVLGVGGVKFSSLEAPGLVHVNPDSIVRQLIVQIIQSFEPHVGTLGIEPVDEHCDLGPYLVDQIVIVSLVLVESRLDENVGRVSNLVVLVGQVLRRDASVDYWNYLLFVLM